jgi:hypothetical protein
LRLRGLLLAALLVSLVVAVVSVSLRDLSVTIALITLFALPLALSVAALLDAARRPEWVWALAGRARIVWMLAILFGAFVLPVGIAVSTWYLLRIRPELRDAEMGRIRDK